jgi:hypothetical protein
MRNLIKVEEAKDVSKKMRDFMSYIHKIYLTNTYLSVIPCTRKEKQLN